MRSADRRRALVVLIAVLAVSVAVLVRPGGMAAQSTIVPLPLTPPPPDLTLLVPFAAAPVAKPPVPTPEVALPESPEDLPVLPLAPIVIPPDRPTAPLPSVRTLPCVGAWLRIASESLECGRARYGRGEYEDAARALEQAVRNANERPLLREARYWLAETYWRLARFEQADFLFRQIAQDSRGEELAVWSLHASGWTALRLGDFARAREAFAQLLAIPLPVPLDSWGRFGHGLASYALSRHDEAFQYWSDLAGRGPHRTLTRDLFFWHGEALGRVGQYGRADAELGRFVRAGAHPLLETGMLRLGWWSLRGGRYPESAAALRTYLADTQRGQRREQPAERDWGEAGLAIAVLAQGDWDAARAGARALQARQSPLATPVLLRLAGTAVEKRRTKDALGIIQDLLGAKLEPPSRAWVLLLNGEAHRLDGNRDDARTQYELVSTVDANGLAAQHARVRLAQTNFELREFAQAVNDLAQPISSSAPELRAAALLLRAEAAHAAGDHATADASYRQLLVENPNYRDVALVRLSIAWAALLRNEFADARRQFIEFARAYPAHANAADALVLASELALTGNDLEGGRQLLDQVITQHPGHPRTELARLNRGILLVRTGKGAAAEPELSRWVSRAPFPPLVGRAHAALGAALLQAGRVADAGRQFTRARAEGMGAVAALGLGGVAIAEGRWDDAARELTEARDTGTAPIVTAAEYGLAAVAFQRGDAAEFKRVATAALDAAPSGPMAPRLLYTLTGISVDERDWPRALASARRLISQFKGADVGDDALERVGAGAAKAAVWPVVVETYQLLRQQYPQSPFVETSRVTLAEAQLETGQAAQAVRELQSVAGPSAQDARVLVLLARARQATGDRAGALDAYTRASRSAGATEWNRQALLGFAGLLGEEKRADEARAVLAPLMKSEDTGTVVEAAHVLGRTYQAAGDPLAAAEYYMTAAYLAPDSLAGRRALLAAGQSFAALRQIDAAAIAYRKLLDQPDVPADLAAAARQGLTALGRP